MDNFKLRHYRKIQQFELSDIKLKLTRTYGISIDSVNLSSLEGKKKLCDRISTALHNSLIEELAQYNSEQLICLLLSLHEACVQKRAEQALELPVKIALFSSFSEELFNFFEKEQDRIKTALSLRCLIELIVASNGSKGKKSVSFDDIDRLIALMFEMTVWATLSDGINLGLQNPTIRSLACGRIDIDYSSINYRLLPFGIARTKNEFYQYSSGYEQLFAHPNEDFDQKNPPEEIRKAEQVFKSEWGIELLRLHEFLIDLVEFTRSNSGSVVGIEESLLFEELRKSDFNWTDSEIKAALSVLTLLSGWKVGSPPKGYDKSDTYPWCYNRALSFLYRPIARLTQNNRIIYYWSYRHLFAAFDNIMVLFFNGSLKVPANKKLEALIKDQRTKRGKEFRNRVCSWLSNHTNLEVISSEVPIRPGAKLGAAKDLGDIDILCYDHQLAVVYSIECKDTVESKAVHEMKTEVDKYLGRDGKPGMIQKHVNRDNWLRNNIPSLNAFVKDASFYSITSLVVTSEEIPLPYLKKDSIPMPFISFTRLQREGGNLGNSL